MTDYIGGPYDITYYFNNKKAGYTDYTVGNAQATQIANDIEARCGLVSEKRILDIGCAFGYLVKELTDRRAECFGIDVSSYAINYAKTLFPTLSSNFTIQDIVVGTSFTNAQQFDIIVAAGVLGCLSLTQKSTALAEMGRIRKTTGKIYCLTERISDYYHVTTEDSWQLKFGNAFGGLVVATDIGDQPFGYGWRLVMSDV